LAASLFVVEDTRSLLPTTENVTNGIINKLFGHGKLRIPRRAVEHQFPTGFRYIRVAGSLSMQVTPSSFVLRRRFGKRLHAPREIQCFHNGRLQFGGPSA